MLDRRHILSGALALPFLSGVARGQSTARVVVVGGGFGGATVARFIRRFDPRIAVTLVEANPDYTACPYSNEVIAGLRPLSAQRFDYKGVVAAGVTLVQGSATGVDATAKRVTLADGSVLSYDRLVLSPGIDIAFDKLPGYDAAAADIMPHAWKAGAQTDLLRRQLDAMKDGGTVVISAPANPYRCPPGPYERASLIAFYLKTKKPKSKLLLLDAKDAFSKQKLFEAGWARLYPGLLERVSQSDGGTVTSVDPGSLTFKTDFGDHKADVANVIPPQRAGSIAATAGVADRTGWCPIDPVSFESRLVPGIHVIGDAAIAGAMPKSAFAANAQAKVCALAVVALLNDTKPAEPILMNTCYSLLAPADAISVAGVYHPQNGLLTDIDGAGGTSPLDAPASFRAQEAGYADAWFQTITTETFAKPAAIVVLAVAGLLAGGTAGSGEPLVAYRVAGDRIDAPLTGIAGDPARGRALMLDLHASTCLLCHAGAFPEQQAQGTVGPSLAGVGSRLSPGQIRLRLVNAAAVNPETVMPSFYKVAGLTRVGRSFQDRPVLNADQIEDVVAFLATLRTP